MLGSELKLQPGSGYVLPEHLFLQIPLKLNKVKDKKNYAIMNDGEGPKSRRKTSKKLVRLERIKNPPISLNSEVTLCRGIWKEV